MANVVIEEDLDGVLVAGVYQQQLPRAAALVARLPKAVEIPDRKRPARRNERLTRCQGLESGRLSKELSNMLC